jgi:mevalonate kinase
MKWRIPAKTFLVGEYAAIASAGAIILTTTPCFELSVAPDDRVQGIHPNSPAGRWWAHHCSHLPDLSWYDPYQGKGGLGASSAQFLGTYLARCHLLHTRPNYEALLDAYYQYAWQGEGLKPSGYDVLAQSQNHCVYINRQQKLIKSNNWPFKDISFLLLHSGQKLATHRHLKNTVLPNPISQLSTIVESAQAAFEQANSEKLVEAVNAYQQQLANLDLLAPHSLKQIQALKAQTEILATKGCGALGADVLLLIVPTNYLKSTASRIKAEGWEVLATSEDLYDGFPYIENNPSKTYSNVLL